MLNPTIIFSLSHIFILAHDNHDDDDDDNNDDNNNNLWLTAPRGATPVN